MADDFDQLRRALDAQCATFGTLVDATPDLGAPTALDGWTCAVLVGHVGTALQILWRWRGEPPPGTIEVDRVSWWDGVDPAGNDDFAQRYAAKRSHDEIRAGLAESISAATACVGAATPDSHLVAPGAIATTRFDEAVATRVFELVVHGIDLADAIGSPTRPGADALAIACDLLDRRLAGGRPSGLDDGVAWVRAATGRDAHPDARLPVVS